MDTNPTPAEKTMPTGRDFGGVWVTLGDRQYKIPPLNFRKLKELMPKLVSVGKIEKGSTPTPEQMDTIIEIVDAAVKRNYPDLTREEVENIVDAGNMIEAMNAVMNVSGLVATKGGESGEA